MPDFSRKVSEIIFRDPQVKARLDKLRDEAEMYGDLKSHPAWKRLHDRLVMKRGEYLLALSARLMSGREVSQREIDYNRGYYDGAIYAVSHPAIAEVALEKAASAAWALGMAELEADSLEDSPHLIPDKEG